MKQESDITFRPIGVFRTKSTEIPRHWSLSEMEGIIEIDRAYEPGLKDIAPGQKMVVLFHFDRSRKFDEEYLTQTPPHRDTAMGVFSICSPIRPNAIGMSVLLVIDVQGNRIRVTNADMLDGTPILDIKPHIEHRHECPSFEKNG